jgi:hypothetical protein
MSSLRRSRVIVLAAPLFAFAFTAQASTFIVTDDELEPDVFPAVAESIRVNLNGPSAPQGMSPAKEKRVLRSLERIQAYLDEDPQRHQSRIRNEQARLNAALAPQVARQGSRSDMVCERIRPVGSNIPTTRCRSRQQVEEDRVRALEEIDRLRQVDITRD